VLKELPYLIGLCCLVEILQSARYRSDLIILTAKTTVSPKGVDDCLAQLSKGNIADIEFAQKQIESRLKGLESKGRCPERV
jgi:hypothetical protein